MNQLATVDMETGEIVEAGAIHPAALIPPPLAADDYVELKADIAANGLLHPIRTIDGLIIDGRHRFRACAELSITPAFEEYKGPLTPLQYVLANVRHRHMTAGQKAIMALDIERYEAEEARKRQGTRSDIQEIIPESQKGQARDKAAAQVGVNPHYVSDAKRLQSEAPDLLEKVRAGESNIVQAKRELKERKREDRRDQNRGLIAKAPEPLLVGAKFATIMLDPPWDWGDEGDQDQLGRARPTYGTMTIDEIEKLPVPNLSDDDCHLYLWITNRSLPKGFRLLEAWGFRYVTCLTWAKPSFGMGNYFRGQTEHVLFGVKGSQPLKRKDVGTLFSAPRGPKGHSSKPPEFYQLIESCSPGPYLEMFARSSRTDWKAWGAEANAA